jgi:hypothetical protein
VAVLRVERGAMNPQDLDGAMERTLAGVEAGGTWGVARRQGAALGELEGWWVELTELRPPVGEPGRSLWQVSVAAEDGVYSASLLGETAVLGENRALLESCLLSLRVTLPP